MALVLPCCFGPDGSRAAYLAVAETFAPLAECLLFRAAFGTDRCRPAGTVRDGAAIVLANLASFGLGEVTRAAGWWGGA